MQDDLPSMDNREESSVLQRITSTVARQRRFQALRRSSWMSEDNDSAVKELVLRRSCCECMLLAPLFVIIVFLQYAHMSTKNAYTIEKVLLFEILSKPFGYHSLKVTDVHDARMFWEWFESLLSSTLIVQEDELGHKLPEEQWGYLSYFNRYVGGIHLQQSRGDLVPCPGNSEGVCHSNIIKSEAVYGYPACTNASADEVACYFRESYRGDVDADHDEGFTFDSDTGYFEMWLDPLVPSDVAYNRIKYLEDRHWIDKQTRIVKVELLTENHEFEHLLSEVVITFVFDRAGYVGVFFQVETIPVDPYAVDVGMKTFLSLLFVLINMFSLLHLVRMSYTVRAQGYGLGGTLLYMCKESSSEVIQAFVSIFTIVLWVTYVKRMKSLAQMIAVLDRPSAHPSEGYQAWLDYHHNIVKIEMFMKVQVKIVRTLREVCSLMFLSILITCFKVWSGIPALSHVTQTIYKSFSRLGALMLAAGTLLFLFAGAGMVVYGTQLTEFSDIILAAKTTAIVCLTGEHEIYDKMTKIDSIFASLWYWALVFLMFMVVLNQALGILLDAATNAQVHSGVGLTSQFLMVVKPWILIGSIKALIGVADPDDTLPAAHMREMGYRPQGSSERLSASSGGWGGLRRAGTEPDDCHLSDQDLEEPDVTLNVVEDVPPPKPPLHLPGKPARLHSAPTP